MHRAPGLNCNLIEPVIALKCRLFESQQTDKGLVQSLKLGLQKIRARSTFDLSSFESSRFSKRRIFFVVFFTSYQTCHTLHELTIIVTFSSVIVPAVVSALIRASSYSSTIGERPFYLKSCSHYIFWILPRIKFEFMFY